MDTFNASKLRNFILSTEITEPILFRKLHEKWWPVTQSLETWGKILEGSCEKSFVVRCGEKEQSEIKVKKLLNTLNSFILFEIS